MSNPEAPTFHGAAKVYQRGQAICARLNAAEYQEQLRRNKGKRLRTFTPSADASHIIDAMNRADEETLKSAVWHYRSFWLGEIS